MELSINLQKAAELKLELDGLRPLSPEQEKRIMQKFRLDWNYHSSHIEGNTLTYGETKALILFGHTAQAKPLQDHLEMSGHDEAIKYIEDVIKKERPLTESFIREMHKLLLKQPYQVDAITPDGQATKKWVQVGSYKKTPNHVETKTGETFYFALPEETPAKMAELLDWYKEQSVKKDIQPVVFATEFHYRLIRIHPFDDGNGRIARLLMNFILMQFGYPPAIIKTENKNDYYNALEQADAGQLDFFFNYISEEVVNSLELMIRGAKGEEIEEPDDLDKKLLLLKKHLGEEADNETRLVKNPANVKEVLETSIKPLIISVENVLKKFDAFFKSRKVDLKYGNNYYTGIDLATVYNNFMQSKEILNLRIKPIYNIEVKSNFLRLRKSNNNSSIKGIDLGIFFQDFVYEIRSSVLTQPINKLYHQPLSENEILKIVQALSNWQYNLLEEIINKQSD